MVDSHKETAKFCLWSVVQNYNTALFPSPVLFQANNWAALVKQTSLLSYPLSPGLGVKLSKALGLPALWFFFVERSRTPSENKQRGEKKRLNTTDLQLYSIHCFSLERDVTLTVNVCICLQLHPRRNYFRGRQQCFFILFSLFPIINLSVMQNTK